MSYYEDYDFTWISLAIFGIVVLSLIIAYAKHT